MKQGWDQSGDQQAGDGEAAPRKPSSVHRGAIKFQLRCHWLVGVYEPAGDAGITRLWHGAAGDGEEIFQACGRSLSSRNDTASRRTVLSG
jgi:hypothetical protein